MWWKRPDDGSAISPKLLSVGVVVVTLLVVPLIIQVGTDVAFALSGSLKVYETPEDNPIIGVKLVDTTNENIPSSGPPNNPGCLEGTLDVGLQQYAEGRGDSLDLANENFTTIPMEYPAANFAGISIPCQTNKAHWSFYLKDGVVADQDSNYTLTVFSFHVIDREPWINGAHNSLALNLTAPETETVDYNWWLEMGGERIIGQEVVDAPLFTDFSYCASNASLPATSYNCSVASHYLKSAISIGYELNPVEMGKVQTVIEREGWNQTTPILHIDNVSSSVYICDVSAVTCPHGSTKKTTYSPLCHTGGVGNVGTVSRSGCVEDIGVKSQGIFIDAPTHSFVMRLTAVIVAIIFTTLGIASTPYWDPIIKGVKGR